MAKVKLFSDHDIAYLHLYFTVKVTTARSKVKSRSHYDIAHLHPPTNVPTMYQIVTVSEIEPEQI